MSEIQMVYTRIKSWVDEYGNAGQEDKRAIEEFIMIEAAEAVNLLRGELMQMAKGNYSQDNLDKIVGIKRRVKHGSYDEWAKLMLIWMANYKP